MRELIKELERLEGLKSYGKGEFCSNVARGF